MISRLVARNDGTDEDPSWTLEGDGAYLTDNPSLDGIWDWVKAYQAEHPNEIEKLTIYFTN